MWFLGLWPAGDAKLFAVLMFFIPDDFMSTGILLDYSVNIFVPIFFFLTGYVLFKGRDKLVEGLKYAFDPYRIFMLFVILIGFVGWIVKLIALSGIRVGFFIILLLLFISFEIFYMIPTFRTEVFFTFVAVSRIIFDFETIMTVSYAKEFFSMIGLFVVLRFFVIYVVYHFYGREVEIEDLEPGMSPSEGIVRRDDGFEKVKFLNASFIDYMRQRKEDYLHGLIELSEEDVKKLKQMKEDGELGVDTLFIDKTQHFAFMICMGFVITFLIGTDILNYVVGLI